MTWLQDVVMHCRLIEDLFQKDHFSSRIFNTLHKFFKKSALSLGFFVRCTLLDFFPWAVTMYFSSVSFPTAPSLVAAAFFFATCFASHCHSSLLAFLTQAVSTSIFPVPAPDFSVPAFALPGWSPTFPSPTSTATFAGWSCGLTPVAPMVSGFLMSTSTIVLSQLH